MAFDGIKDLFGFSTVKVEIDCDTRFSIEQESIQGRLTLTGLRDQEISEVKMEFVEEWTSYSDELNGEDYSKVVGTDLLLNQTILLKEDEQISCEFAVPFELSWSPINEMKKQDGLLGVIGKVASLAADVLPDDLEREVTYKLIARVDVKSTRADPDCEITLQRIDWGPFRGPGT